MWDSRIGQVLASVWLQGDSVSAGMCRPAVCVLHVLRYATRPGLYWVPGSLSRPPGSVRKAQGSCWTALASCVRLTAAELAPRHWASAA